MKDFLKTCEKRRARTTTWIGERQEGGFELWFAEGRKEKST
jgi:hypothetical protein